MCGDDSNLPRSGNKYSIPCINGRALLALAC